MSIESRHEVRQCAMCHKSVALEAIEVGRATKCRRCERRLHLRCVVWLKILPIRNKEGKLIAALGYFGEKTEHCRRCAAELVIAYDEIEVAL